MSFYVLGSFTSDDGEKGAFDDDVREFEGYGEVVVCGWTDVGVGVGVGEEGEGVGEEGEGVMVVGATVEMAVGVSGRVGVGEEAVEMVADVAC